ncbi:lipocalin family protein [Henriciella sp. AS95]|uniref:lipocalin family protein n=1 Tax=Henriciella sp. AS95 TaxID=3135782 RepID=UPI0031820154
MIRALALAATSAIALSACSYLSQPDYREESTPPQTVASVDLEKYAGLWHEIARYPNSFEKGCTDTTAEYGLRDDGRISVTNSCTKEKTGKRDVAEGVAKPVEGSNNSKLKVKFAPEWVPFAWGDYWILHLEPDYSAALVGSPNGKYLWILARDEAPDQTVIDRILKKAEALGYETGPLEFAG